MELCEGFAHQMASRIFFSFCLIFFCQPSIFQIFECRAHIYQGQFELRNLRRGLDHFHPSIRIVMASESQTTQVSLEFLKTSNACLN